MVGFNEIFVIAAGIIARLLEVAAVFFIAIGGVTTAYQATLSLFRRGGLHPRKIIWLHFSSWLLLGLEFELASDIIRSILAPTWLEIGRLAAIAAIRTLLSYFLGRDIADMRTEAGSGKT